MVNESPPSRRMNSSGVAWARPGAFSELKLPEVRVGAEFLPCRWLLCLHSWPSVKNPDSYLLGANLSVAHITSVEPHGKPAIRQGHRVTYQRISAEVPLDYYPPSALGCIWVFRC